MPESIRDGKGRGYLAEVDAEGRLVVNAQVRSHISHHSLNGHENAFNMYFRHTQQADATNEIIGYFTYTGDNYLVVEKIVFSTNSAGETKFEAFADPTGLSGGATTTPTNLKIGSGKTLSLTSKDTNKGASPITSTTEGTEILDIRMGWQAIPVYEYDFKGALVLSKNDTLMLLANSATSGDIIRANILYFEESSYQ
jgi:hypothetical protein